MIDFHDKAYVDLKLKIDHIIRTTPAAAAVEKRKGEVLAQSDEYVDFLARGANATTAQVRDAIRELANDDEFFASISAGLEDLASVRGFEPGELRVHSYTVYVIARLLKPNVVVETGVANGKSSAFVLRALDRAQQGALVSIDLPQLEGEALSKDNCGTTLAGRGTGWLVPADLRKRWTLQLGDARELLPPLVKSIPSVDVFFHDSLHTYDHMLFEIDLALKWLTPAGVIMCDDIRNNSAFEEKAAGRNAAAFGTFGTIRA